jgi:hypothetical protein
MKGWRRNYEDSPDRGERIRLDRRILRTLRRVKTWQLLVILLLFVMLAAIFLRLNNLGMVERREALIAADKTGDITAVQTAAQDLQNYVAHHMNTMTGRVALQTLYEQDFNKITEANKPPEIAGADYQAALKKCHQIYPRNGQKRAQCVADTVGVSEVEVPENLSLPSPDAYYVNYVPARLSFDLAGLSVLICLLLIITVIFRLLFVFALKIILKFKYRAAEN